MTAPASPQATRLPIGARGSYLPLANVHSLSSGNRHGSDALPSLRGCALPRGGSRAAGEKAARGCRPKTGMVGGRRI